MWTYFPVRRCCTSSAGRGWSGGPLPLLVPRGVGACVLHIMADARGGPVTTWWVGLRQHAHDSRPAYALSALCAMSMPFGFGQAIKMAGNEAAKKAPRLIPPFWQMLGFSVFFGTGAYMICLLYTSDAADEATIV